MEKDIETHIEKDKKILEDPTISPQMRRHTADEPPSNWEDLFIENFEKINIELNSDNPD